MNSLKNFEETSLDEILFISYEMWEQSIEEYKKTIDFENNITYKDAMKYRYYHCKLTGDIALNLYRKYSNNKDEEVRLIYLAALIHDIKKLHKKHSIAGAEWAEVNLKEYFNISNEDVEIVALLIRHHKSSKRKLDYIDDKNIINLIILLQIADSLSKFKEKSLYKEVDEEKVSKKLKEVLFKFKNDNHKEK